MRYLFRALTAVVALILLAAPAMADYPVDQIWKWWQWPNEGFSTTYPAWDVNFTYPKVLADDFYCYQPMKITDVHIWFSVEHDQIGQDATGFPDPLAVQRAIESVRLSIHKDIPADPAPPSRPGEELWAGVFKDFKVAWWGQGPQGWIEPQIPAYWTYDHYNIWLLNIDIPPETAFEQKGTPENPIVYWLDASVKLRPEYENVRLGWKTSINQWRDDAFWGHLISPDPPIDGVVASWEGPLIDPIFRHSLDLAFIITPEPGTVAMLMGAGLVGLLAYGRRRKRS